MPYWDTYTDVWFWGVIGLFLSLIKFIWKLDIDSSKKCVLVEIIGIQFRIQHIHTDLLIECFYYYSRLTEGYSGSDLNALAKDAALGPIRGKCLIKK